jgi:hypothetical protein
MFPSKYDKYDVPGLVNIEKTIQKAIEAMAKSKSWNYPARKW